MAVTGDVYNTGLLKRIFQYVKPYRAVFVWSVILTILLAAISPVRPFLIKYTLDHYILTGNYSGLVNMTMLMIFMLILQTLIQYNHTLLTNTLGQSVIRDLRINVFNHITKLHLKFFDKTPIGQLITRTVSDLETIADIFSEGLISMIGDSLQVLVIVGVMLYTDWQLSLVVLLPIPLLIMATRKFQKAIKVAFQEIRNEVSNLNTFLQEHITGVSIVQYFAREKQEYRKFYAINKRYRDANIRSNWYYSIFFPVVELISAMSLGLLVWYGAKSILSKPLDVTPGTITQFIMYLGMVFTPIRQLADKFNTLQMGMVGAERVFKVLDTDETTLNNGIQKPAKLVGNIKFQNVWFAYNDDHYVLKDLNFEVKAGETVALVGATGAGKSSTINILNRFYEVKKGDITVDGIRIDDFELDYLRSHIATVLQDVFLFSDTILNNITLNNPEITIAEVVNAAKKVGAHDFIERLPGGYQYNVMERGATLSAGQAQLISFIRALVHNPAILVLDEATSSVDTETELLIQKAIDNLMEGRTSIVIAHRLSTIQKADQIIVLDKGEIKEKGTHQQLLKLNGYYKKLYDLQFSSKGIAKV
ncbi:MULTISPECIES: ABC transporter ATP-binding protein [unclassified Pedobacter]|uniref:ABC transporter ATP-binding protein n=1 Tax=unclassified Pedobacter TaxID=2628915 RepID=UPI00142247F8|nr:MULTISPECIES: ABC transporter ATP-binding protein [unclassified Pedobacter]NII85349.1 ATP-binding cassette subfamily B protein [Pedobacter sp. SG908]NMN39736.1 ATP-binding cassette subfamily B protein [Pedobacter sp. SG918]